ncbi:MAG: single-stranded DNA-binding protein [Chloroflexi bacterium]|nr:MAG: single-stranded DNA-binding protein [Chloroflexi bacterium OLB13]MBV6436398.1 Single-stranded DNA-binding protein [Anaerolineae bacterium]MCC6565806.1 single-stranded DNA-binding protein [Chloroflexota bacterium]MBW7879921.1 single-stranded DNA-binding protein [Anaerolineae bacterium]MCO6444127.1 single-stranded DNA-binding protein [Anaerolineae bacterium]
MYQQITIVGNVGRDPELRYLQDGVAVCDFSVAVNRRFGTGEEARDETTWFRVSVWRNQAEVVAKYVKKGRQVMVVGEVKANPYMDKSGQPAASLDITAHTVKFLGGRDDSEGGGGERGDEDFRPSGKKSGGRAPETSEDIPF